MGRRYAAHKHRSMTRRMRGVKKAKKRVIAASSKKSTK